MPTFKNIRIYFLAIPILIILFIVIFGGYAINGGSFTSAPIVDPSIVKANMIQKKCAIYTRGEQKKEFPFDVYDVEIYSPARLPEHNNNVSDYLWKTKNESGALRYYLKDNACKITVYITPHVIEYESLKEIIRQKKCTTNEKEEPSFDIGHVVLEYKGVGRRDKTQLYYEWKTTQKNNTGGLYYEEDREQKTCYIYIHVPKN